MEADHTRPTPPDRHRQEVALRRLGALVGTWRLDLTVPTTPPSIVDGLWSTFEWMDGGLFLVWRWGPPRPDFPGGLFPSALSIVGYDDAAEQFFVHYYDSRGVVRVLDMSLTHDAWKIWRASPDFSQRFAATIGADGLHIQGTWERSRDGRVWERDFDMTFRRDG